MQTLDLKIYIFLVDFSDHHMSAFTELPFQWIDTFSQIFRWTVPLNIRMKRFSNLQRSYPLDLLQSNLFKSFIGYVFNIIFKNKKRYRLLKWQINLKLQPFCPVSMLVFAQNSSFHLFMNSDLWNGLLMWPHGESVIKTP